ncbi:MAG: DUF2203 domain-containing protein [Planctomycetota bacterium]|nr:DUF2203 domain-containing protein [Planctomycetota bacterium]
MARSNPVEVKKKFFTLEEANKALPLVKAIVSDVVKQFESVHRLRERLAGVQSERESDPRREPRPRPQNDPYTEELAHSLGELESEEEKLGNYIDELNKLGVELKSLEGLCDFPSMMDGREVYLCWRLGEPAVEHWHEVNDGFAGRQPISSPIAALSSRGGN